MISISCLHPFVHSLHPPNLSKWSILVQTVWIQPRIISTNSKILSTWRGRFSRLLTGNCCSIQSTILSTYSWRMVVYSSLMPFCSMIGPMLSLWRLLRSICANMLNFSPIFASKKVSCWRWSLSNCQVQLLQWPVNTWTLRQFGVRN